MLDDVRGAFSDDEREALHELRNGVFAFSEELTNGDFQRLVTLAGLTGAASREVANNILATLQHAVALGILYATGRESEAVEAIREMGRAAERMHRG